MYHLNSFFNQVQLGALHSERLRKAILDGAKLGENDYEVAIIGIQEHPELITNMITPPRKIKQGSNTHYVVLINGLYFLFNISQEDKSTLLVKSRLKEDGSMIIPLLEGDMAKLYYDSLMSVTIRKKQGQNRND